MLISAGDLSGFEFGAGPLNPYEQFKQLHPIAVIDYGVFVFQGHFEIPLAAALGHDQQAGKFQDAKKYPEALAEIQQAVALAPDSVQINYDLGDILSALGRHDEAHQSYAKALHLAQTIEPEFQEGGFRIWKRSWPVTSSHPLADVTSAVSIRQDDPVRTILNLDNDVLAQARIYADRRSLTLGRAVSDLIRHGLGRLPHTQVVNGLHVVALPKDSPTVDTEHVSRLLNHDLTY